VVEKLLKILGIYISNSIDYTGTQIDGTPNGKIREQTTFCPTDIVRYTVVGGAGVALD
jgi:hypothetical protein